MHKLKAFVLVLSVLFPFYISLREIANDSIPFWYDPARDMLLAWDNLSKFTLIGPPSGIPGIFYGPQWLWFLSLGLIISKDPRVVAVLISAIPYFTIFPFLLFRFSRIFGYQIAVLIWLFFIFGYKTYTTYIWSPHLAPLFLLVIIYLLTFTDIFKRGFVNYLRIFVAGIFAGLLLNVHISFGVAIVLACLLFLFSQLFIYKKRNFGVIFLFISGFLLAISPNLIFEARHGFNQIKAIVETINKSLHGSAVVGYLGLTKLEIIKEFLKVSVKLLAFPQTFGFLLYPLIFLHVVYNHKSYLKGYSPLAKKLLLLLSALFFSTLAVFLSAKNPVWTYHFIGTEIAMALLIGLILSKFSALKNLLSVWIIFIIITNIFILVKSSATPEFKVSNLATKKHIADIIYQDTKSLPFALYVYSTAIYTFDYDYIFRWYGTYLHPGELPQNPYLVNTTYLIIPDVAPTIEADFINYRTPDKEYKTVKKWEIPDGTTILKREKAAL